MRKWLCTILLVVLLNVCFVTALEPLEVYNQKIYINNDLYDDDDEDIEQIVPGDTIMIKYYLENLNGTYDIEDIEFEYIVYDIEDGDDLEKDYSDFNLDRGDKEKKEIEIQIPNDAEEDTYDFEVEIRYIFQGDLHQYIYNYTIEIDEEAVEDKEKEDFLDNLSVMLARLEDKIANINVSNPERDKGEYQSLFEKEEELRKDLDVKLVEKEVAFNKATQDLLTCTQGKANIETTVTSVRAEKEMVESDCEALLKSANDQVMWVGAFFLAVIAVLVWWFKFKDKPGFGKFGKESSIGPQLPQSFRPPRSLR